MSLYFDEKESLATFAVEVGGVCMFICNGEKERERSTSSEKDGKVDDFHCLEEALNPSGRAGVLQVVKRERSTSSKK